MKRSFSSHSCSLSSAWPAEANILLQTLEAMSPSMDAAALSGAMACAGWKWLASWEQRWLDRCCLILIGTMWRRCSLDSDLSLFSQQDLPHILPQPQAVRISMFDDVFGLQALGCHGFPAGIDRCLVAQLCVGSFAPGTAVAQGAPGRRAAEGHAAGAAL